jgi:hypothetical protein
LGLQSTTPFFHLYDSLYRITYIAQTHQKNVSNKTKYYRPICVCDKANGGDDEYATNTRHDHIIKPLRIMIQSMIQILYKSCLCLCINTDTYTFPSHKHIKWVLQNISKTSNGYCKIHKNMKYNIWVLQNTNMQNTQKYEKQHMGIANSNVNVQGIDHLSTPEPGELLFNGTSTFTRVPRDFPMGEQLPMGNSSNNE